MPDRPVPAWLKVGGAVYPPGSQPADTTTSQPAAVRFRPDQPAMVTTIRVLAGASGLLAVVVMTGWVLDVETLTRLSPALATMKFNAALGVALLALTWFTPPPAVRLLSLLVVLISVATLVEHITGLDLRIDQLVVDDPATSSPGRTSAATVICLLLLAAGRLVVLTGARGRLRAAQVLAVASLLLSSTALLGYLFGVRPLYSAGPFTTIALDTVLALEALAVVCLAAVPGGLLPWVVHGSDVGAVMMRRVVPAALIVLPLLNWLRLLGERRGWYSTELGVAFATMASVVVVTAVAALSAWWLSDSDEQRAAAVRELRELNVDLERRIRRRADELAAQAVRIAVLEDRQRIAADLHDHVVQRLFAAALRIQSAETAAAPVARRESLAGVVDDLDDAIVELRKSIVELKRGYGSTTLRSAIEALAGHFASALGTTPIVDLAEDLPIDDLTDDVTAVLAETLANIARHAEARTVCVDARCSPLPADSEHPEGSREFVLTVSDDGRGLPAVGVAAMATEVSATGHGLSNVRRRAEQRGGSCVWLPNSPTGTRVVWRVPIT